jgi:hypothetical protein
VDDRVLVHIVLISAAMTVGSGLEFRCVIRHGNGYKIFDVAFVDVVRKIKLHRTTQPRAHVSTTATGWPDRHMQYARSMLAPELHSPPRRGGQVQWCWRKKLNVQLLKARNRPQQLVARDS